MESPKRSIDLGKPTLHGLAFATGFLLFNLQDFILENTKPSSNSKTSLLSSNYFQTAYKHPDNNRYYLLGTIALE